MGTRKVGLAAWIRDLETLEDRAAEALPKVVRRGAVNVKEEWRTLWEAVKKPPTHIPHLVRGIGYDTVSKPPRWSAEIGVARSNSQSPIAHLLEYGSIHNPPYPGGKAALDAEEPRFVKAVGDAAEGLLDG